MDDRVDPGDGGVGSHGQESDNVAAMFANRMYRIAVVCLLSGLIGSVLTVPAMAKKRATKPSSCSGVIRAFVPGSEPEPMELSGPLEPAALGKFAVLRRAAVSADQLPPLNGIGSRVGLELSSYYPGYIRQLVRLANGSRYFLIPGFKRVPNLPPARCLPKQLRHLRQPKPESVYCVAGIGPTVRPLADVNCQTLAEIETGGDLAEPYFSSSFQVDLVPDGVAAVRLVYRGGHVVNAPVGENAFAFTTPRELIEHAKAAFKRFERAFENERRHRHLTRRQRQHSVEAMIKALDDVVSQLPPKQVQWLDAGGHVLRSFTPRRVRRGFLVTSIRFVSSANAVRLG